MIKKNHAMVLFIVALLAWSCGSEDDVNVEEEQEQQEEQKLGVNEMMFSDDNMICSPFSSDPSISPQGILSVIMKPCQNSGSKLDAYFKYNTRPTPGVYNATAVVGSLSNLTQISETEFTMVFYGHTAEALYSTAGTVELTVNADDDTKLDMTWTDLTMEASDGTSVKFSGSLTAL